MSSISIETKKATELDALQTLVSGNLFLVHDGNGLKKVEFDNLKSAILGNIEEEIALLTVNNAGAHNAIYRGKNLGTSVTAKQWAAISAGTFDDLFIGDYWVINEKTWRIAAFDYWLGCGQVDQATHHVVIVPDTSLYLYTMNSSGNTNGGYVGSTLYTEGLSTAEQTIYTAFGEDNVLLNFQWLSNAVTGGMASACAWYPTKVVLMNEVMVYGCRFHTKQPTGTTNAIATIDKSQLPLFTFRPELIIEGYADDHSTIGHYWLRDVVGTMYYACVGPDGLPGYATASSASLGVRPVFAIGTGSSEMVPVG